MQKANSYLPAIAVLTPIILLFTGCGTVRTEHPVPLSRIEEATIPGIPRARFWGDESPDWWDEVVSVSEEAIKKRYSGTYAKPHNYLAISGGGANGAFGAGILCGWTEEGSRPEFTIATGVSTGALIAPFAFLGSNYDHILKKVYTTVQTKDLMDRRSIFMFLLADGMAKSQGLRCIIERYVDKNLVSEIAAEHRKGRRLYIGTTNLDVGRPVIWNIGEISLYSDQERARQLIIQIMLASASIPGMFSPVYFEVEVEGEKFQEMHVDGGTTSQVFLYPSSYHWKNLLKKFHVTNTPNLYVIRNSWIRPHKTWVKPRVLSITERSILTLIRTQGLGDLYRMYLTSFRDGQKFNLAFIPDNIPENAKEPFDPEFMRDLFEYGYNQSYKGYPWQNYPPGFEIDHPDFKDY